MLTKGTGITLIHDREHLYACNELNKIVTINQGFKYEVVEQDGFWRIARYKLNPKKKVIKTSIELFDIQFKSNYLAEQALKTVLFNKELEKYKTLIRDKESDTSNT